MVLLVDLVDGLAAGNRIRIALSVLLMALKKFLSIFEIVSAQ